MSEIKVTGPATEALDTDLLARAHAILPRLAAADATLWGPEAEAEARIRLGWIDLPETSRTLLQPLSDLARELETDGLTRVVLCGMGGSSLAPEVIAAHGGRRLTVLDSTDPHQIARATVDLERTAVLIASKSGSTIETDSHRRHFIDAFTAAGLDPRRHLIIVTDPDSPLDEQSRAAGMRVIHGDPHVGGRFSALSAFGLTPTAMIGLDPAALLDQAAAAHAAVIAPDSAAVVLAVAMAQQHARGPLMTLAASDATLAGLGDWIEQLVAESTGKQGRGILPVVLESAHAPDFNAPGRLSVLIGDGRGADLSIVAPLGAHFVLWEWATALAGYLLDVDPFNQPNVTESKTNTAALLAEWGGAPPPARPDAVDGPIEIYGAESIPAALHHVSQEVDYLAVMAYLDREGDAPVAAIRSALAHRFPALGVTFGWGPRFLHSTGQFHKGGPATGAFLQITGESRADLAIPGRSYGFATLQLAQALGDMRALAARGRPVVRLHLRDRVEGIAHLLSVAFSS